MLIPYSTDAPIYHLPIATVGTIIVNILIFIPVFMHEDPYGVEDEMISSHLAEMDEEDLPEVDENGQPLSREQRRQILEDFRKEMNLQSGSRGKPIWRLLTLEYGKFRPWQWLTANYLHGGIMHLIGNMFVLWGFGLVVEGKVGWWRFLLIYNAIGIFGLALIQILMLFVDSGFGLGASLAIFGVLAVALVWAPSNNMDCVFMLGFRPLVFEASILMIATFAVFLQMGLSALQIARFSSEGIGIRVTGEIAHLIGAVFGFAIGAVMVKRSLVDCENWDVFSVWAGKNVSTSEEQRENVQEELEKLKMHEERQRAAASALPTMPGTTAVAQSRPAVAATTSVAQPEQYAARFRELVAAGKTNEAWGLFVQAERTCLGFRVDEPDFVKYISVLRQQKQWDQAAVAMQEYLTRYFERETTIRIALAQVYLQLGRVHDARNAVQEINPGLLSDKEKPAYEKIVAAMNRL